MGDYDIAFNVWSQKNGCAASDLIPAPGTDRRAWGVLYEIPADLIRGKRKDKRKTLAQIEGPLYEEKPIRVRDENGNVIEEPVVTFLVIPNEHRDGLWTSFEYVRFIVNGLRAHGVEEVDPAYIQHVIDVAIATNNRAAETATEQIRQIESLRTTS